VGVVARRQPYTGERVSHAERVEVLDDIRLVERGEVDPDPFTIGLGLFAAIAAGGTFLEARRSRQETERVQKDAFRSAWFASRRTLIHFKRAADEFESFMLEDGYARKAFRIGEVRISVDFNRHKSMRRLHGQVLTTANFMADHLDDLSEYLGSEDQPAVDRILVGLKEMSFPESYRDIIRMARTAGELYGDFLQDLGEREGFPQSAESASEE
jgi:hypothetical protein